LDGGKVKIVKRNSYRIISSISVAIAASGVNTYYTVQRNSIDYQAHPVASIIGSIIPGIIAGFAFYWWGSWRARQKQKNLSPIKPKQAAELAASNIDGQYDDAINNFLLKVPARDIREFILNINESSGYVQRAKTALDIRLAEDAEIHSRRTVHLTWALLVVSVALLAFPFLQIIISKNRAANGTDTRTITQTEQPPAVQTPAESEFDREKDQAENGDMIAQFNLGVSYYNGDGVKTNFDEALTWFRRAANQGYVTAQRLVGVFYYNGWGGVAVDYPEAAKWYRKAADQNETTAQWCLGDCYAKGQGVPQDYEEAVNWYRKAADQGDATAQYKLGDFNLRILKNDAEAVKWYRRAAEQNDSAAQDVLARLYRDGQGVMTNLVEAYKWFNLAAASSDDLGGIAARFQRDDLVKQMTADQIAEAQRLSHEFQPHKESAAENINRQQFEDTKAKAEKGDAIAQYNIAVFYWKGQGVISDWAETEKWLRKSAEQGYPAAQVFLASLLIQGKGVVIKKDEVEAAKWYFRAANQNDAEAQLGLGYCYYSGQGVPKNPVEAAKWFELAHAQGQITPGDSLLSDISPQQKAEGLRLAREFKPHTESVPDNSK
jgi:TPR repeat protein